MKKLLLIICSALLLTHHCMAQAKKPTIMVVPSDVWCSTHGFMTEYDNQGTKVRIPDYKRAFQENPELILAISKINGMMAERGFPAKNMESAIKALEQESAEDAILTSKSGAGIEESPMDKLKKIAKADIIIQLTWTVNETGPKKTLSFILQGIDAYTDKQIAEAGSTGAPSFSSDVPTLLGEAAVAYIDNFNATLQAHFDDMFANGREIIVRIKKFSSWDGDFEKEYNGKDLQTVIEDWVRDHAVKNRFSLTDATENMMLFEQVRIPLFDDKNNALDARGFVKGLQRYLGSAPYNITTKLTMKGLGQAVIIVGEK